MLRFFFGFFFFLLSHFFLRICLYERSLDTCLGMFFSVFFSFFLFHSFTIELEGVRTGWLAGAFGVSSFLLSH